MTWQIQTKNNENAILQFHISLESSLCLAAAAVTVGETMAFCVVMISLRSIIKMAAKTNDAITEKNGEIGSARLVSFVSAQRLTFTDP